LNISTTTVIEELKRKERVLVQVNEPLIKQLNPTSVAIVQRVEEAELDEMWSFVGAKKCQRWLWHAIDHKTGQILAYVLADHKDDAFKQLKALLQPFGIQHFYSVRVACRRLRLGSLFTTVRADNSHGWQK
jgi:hypothetical protein